MSDQIPFPDRKYRTILVDVPLNSSMGKGMRARVENHYDTMTVDELKKLKIPADDNCLLLFWAWNNKIPECVEIVKAWGFKWHTLVTWVKPHMGIGNYIRNATEHVIVASVGKKSVEPATRHLSWFMAERREHSRKPEHIYDLAEILGKGPYLEMFARRPREGWDVWGNDPAVQEAMKTQ